MNELLWTLTIIGAWNGVSAIGRIYYQEPQKPHLLYSIVIGAWTAYLLTGGV